MATQIFGRRTVKRRSTLLGQGYGEAAAGGVGIKPNAHPELENLSTGFSNPLKQVGQLARKMVDWRGKDDEVMQNEMAKYKGEGDYYRGSPSRTKGRLAIRRGSR